MSETETIASPSTRLHAMRQGVDLDRLAAELGRTSIAREDVDAATGGAAPAPAPAAGPDRRAWQADHAAWGPVSEEPTTRFARAAAANLAAANAAIPQVTHHDAADSSAIEALRKRLAGEAKARGSRLTPLAVHVRALARALRAFPRFNASLSADGETLILKQYVHVAIAVDTPHGLAVPVIRDADKKGLWRLSDEIADLATRARDRKIAPDEMGGASMTISNLGGLGGRAFTPIVNPPEVAILGITRTRIEPAWTGEEWAPVPMTPLDLSYDHRVINGADAAKFVTYLVGLLEEPERILV